MHLDALVAQVCAAIIEETTITVDADFSAGFKFCTYCIRRYNMSLSGSKGAFCGLERNLIEC